MPYSTHGVHIMRSKNVKISRLLQGTIGTHLSKIYNSQINDVRNKFPLNIKNKAFINRYPFLTYSDNLNNTELFGLGDKLQYSNSVINYSFNTKPISFHGLNYRYQFSSLAKANSKYINQSVHAERSSLKNTGYPTYCIQNQLHSSINVLKCTDKLSQLRFIHTNVTHSKNISFPKQSNFSSDTNNSLFPYAQFFPPSNSANIDVICSRSLHGHKVREIPEHTLAFARYYRRRAMLTLLVLLTVTTTLMVNRDLILRSGPNENRVTCINRYSIAKLFFGRTRSRLFGSLMELKIPLTLRKSLLTAWARAAGINLNELDRPLESFTSIAELFSRCIPKHYRPSAEVSENGLLIPCDGQIIVCGKVKDGKIENVKGTTYAISKFLDESVENPDDFYYAVLYLAPHNYHRFHAPCHMKVSRTKHITGETLPVFPKFVEKMNEVFSLNERVILDSQWNGGKMFYSAVGAYNVGSIVCTFDSSIKTNVRRNRAVDDVSVREYHSLHDLEEGSEVGKFQLGSTIVLIFEAKDNFKFHVEQGSSVQWGQLLGDTI